MSTTATRAHADRAATLIFGRVLATAADAAAPILLVRLLPKEEVGVLSALLVLYATVSLVFLAGLPDVILYHLPTRPAAERRAIATTTVFGLAGLGGLAGTALLLLPLLGAHFPVLLRPFSTGDAGGLLAGGSALGLFALLAVYPLGDLPGRMLPNLLVLEDRTRTAAWAGIAQSGIRTAAIVLPPLLGLGIGGVVASLAASGALTLAAVAVIMRVVYRGVPRRRSPVPLGDLLRFGIPLGVTDIVAGLNGSVDRYLVMFAFTPKDFAEYQAAAWQIPLVTAIAYTVGTACAPRFTEMFKTGRPADAVDLWRRAAVKVSLVVFPVSLVFVIASEETLALLFTDAYVRGATVFRLYSLMTLGRVAAFGTMLVCAGRPRLMLQSAVWTLVANVAFGIPLLALLGFEGPALGALLAFVAMVAIYCRAIGTSAGLPARGIFPVRELARVLLVALAAGVPAALFKHLSGLPPLPTIGGVAAITIPGFLLLGSLSGVIEREDWRRLGRWVRLDFLRG